MLAHALCGTPAAGASGSLVQAAARAAPRREAVGGANTAQDAPMQQATHCQESNKRAKPDKFDQEIGIVRKQTKCTHTVDEVNRRRKDARPRVATSSAAIHITTDIRLEVPSTAREIAPRARRDHAIPTSATDTRTISSTP